MRKTLMFLALAGLVSSLAFATGLSATPGNKYANTTDTRNCDSGDVEYSGPLKLWPPNHKFVDANVTATADDPGAAVTLNLTPALTDVAGGDGGPNHDPDFVMDPPDGMDSGTGSASVDIDLRAERSGKGVGRTYTIDWVASFGGDTCSSMDADQEPFVVTVPHDMRGGADWK